MNKFHLKSGITQALEGKVEKKIIKRVGDKAKYSQRLF